MNINIKSKCLSINLLHGLGDNINNRLNPEKFRELAMLHYSFSNKKPHKICAVTLLLYNIGEITYSIFIKRPIYNGYHSNQFALPGGKKETFDITTAQTAIRETYEELGVAIQTKEIIGMLDPIVIPVSNFVVFPYVVFLSEPPIFNPNEFEVEKFFQYPISELLQPDSEIETEVKVNQDFIKVPAYKIQNQIIWGATAMMLFDFKNRIENLKSGV
jgi:8-oxo-dGTP pyrophosphatase MutT (NUDIX family)